jgi:hypothetical protein
MKTWNVQPANTKQLAALYEITTKVFRKWLEKFEKELAEKAGEKVGIYYNVKQVEFIIDKLGLPPRVKIIYGSSEKIS